MPVSTRIRTHAKEMRKATTREESRLWSWLRNRRFAGSKFRRQVPIGRYIVDFYCAELKLAIEVDGSHHQGLDMIEYDTQRTLFLHDRGIEVLRIPNELLHQDLRLLADLIESSIVRRH